MAGNQQVNDALADDFFTQILAAQPAGMPGSTVMGLQLSSGSGSHLMSPQANVGFLPLEEEHTFLTGTRSHSINMPASVFPPFGHQQKPTIHPRQATQPPVRPRVRARRGQATDPHSIAERVRRERIAERMKALHELVPTANRTDRAAMLDEIVDYVKFLRLQVKVLSMSRLGAAGAVARLVADVPEAAEETDPPWEKWGQDGTEEHVAKLMEEDVGAAMQYLQSKELCMMPISLAATIFRQPEGVL